MSSVPYRKAGEQASRNGSRAKRQLASGRAQHAASISRSLSPPAPRSVSMDVPLDNVALRCHGAGGKDSAPDGKGADIVHLEDLHHIVRSCSLGQPPVSMSSSTGMRRLEDLCRHSADTVHEQGSDKRSADLEPIVECPSEASGVFDDSSCASLSMLPFGTTAKPYEVALHDGPRPTTYSSSCASTAAHSTTYAFCFPENSPPPSTTYTSIPWLNAAPLSSRSVTDDTSVVESSTVELGSPVSFYLEGRPEQYFGRVRCVAHGKYAVDLVNGGRMAWLDEVTPCSESMLMRAERKHLAIKTSKDSYAEYASRNKPVQKSECCHFAGH